MQTINCDYNNEVIWNATFFESNKYVIVIYQSQYIMEFCLFEIMFMDHVVYGKHKDKLSQTIILYDRNMTASSIQM